MPDPTGSESRQPERASGEGAADADFRRWRDQLPSFELDGERLYLPTGDIPMDEGQLAEMWQRMRSARESGDAPTDVAGGSSESDG